MPVKDGRFQVESPLVSRYEKPRRSYMHVKCGIRTVAAIDLNNFKLDPIALQLSNR